MVGQDVLTQKIKNNFSKPKTGFFISSRVKAGGISIFLLFFYAFSSFSPLYSESYNKKTADKFTNKAIQHYHQRQYGAAIILLEKITANYPENELAQEYYIRANEKYLTALLYGRQAQRLKENKLYLQAGRMIDKALDIYPHSKTLQEIKLEIDQIRSNLKPLAHLSLEEKEKFEKILIAGKAELDGGNNELALNIYAKALLMAPESPRAVDGYTISQMRYQEENFSVRTAELFKRAKALFEAKRYTEAKSTYEEILRYDPANTLAIQKRDELAQLIEQLSEKSEKRQLAQEYLSAGKRYERDIEYSKAIEQYQLGNGILSDYTDWSKLIKEAERKREEFEDKRFKGKVVEIEKSFQRGIYFLASEDFARAITEFENVIKIATEYNQLETKREAQELLKKAQENLRRREEEVVTEHSPYYKMVNTIKINGLNAYKAGDYELAKEHFASILELFPKNGFARIYYLKSSIELQPGTKKQIINQFVNDIQSNIKPDPREAKRLLKISLEIDPKNPELIALSKKLHGRSGVVINRTIPKNTLEAWYRDALSQAQSDPQNSLKILKRLLKADPTYAKGRRLMAQLEGRISKDKWSGGGKKVNPQAQKFYSEGIWHYNNGRIRKAMGSFQQALRVEPGFSKARNALEKCRAYLR